MEQFFVELGVFHLLVFFVPGATAILIVLSVSYLLWPETLKKARQQLSTRTVVLFLFLICYLVGVLIDAYAPGPNYISATCLQRNNEFITDEPFRGVLVDRIESEFGVVIDEDQPTDTGFYLCYDYTIAHDIDRFIQIQNTRHKFFNSLATTFLYTGRALFLAAILYIVQWIIVKPIPDPQREWSLRLAAKDRQLLLLRVSIMVALAILLTATSSGLAEKRRKANEQFVLHVYQTFYAHSMSQSDD